MSVTTTSRIAYKDINESGVSKNQKDIIYDIVNGDNTGKGMSLKEISAFTGIEINAVSGRVNDLKKDNRLETATKRKCRITNRLIAPVVIKYAVKSTVKKPKAAEKKERMTYWLSPDLIDKVQAYAYWTPGETISATVETALQQYFKGKRIKSLPKDLQAERDAAKLKKMR